MSPELPRRGGPQRIPRPPASSPGAPPPWQHLIGTDPGLGLDEVRDRLSRHSIDRSMAAVDPLLRRSAVAVLLSGGDALEVLLTRRSWGMRTHRGEVSFAGGAEDDGDEFPVGTALREAAEEVGLETAATSVVGALDPLTTFTSDRVVVPVVVVTDRRPAVRPSPEEVDAILHVPIRDLLHPDAYHQELWGWELESGEQRAGHPMHFFDLPGDTIWGATAAMLHQLLAILLTDPDPR